MKDKVLYLETIASRWTEGLFLVLMMIFLLLFVWRTSAADLDGWAITFLCFGGLFLFYSINFRWLTIELTEVQLDLRFGIFRWRISLDNIADCKLDDALPVMMKYGGAGVHFMWIRGRYRVSFNFLEYPRLLVGLKRKAGAVREVSFTTRHPQELLQALGEAMGARG